MRKQARTNQAIVRPTLAAQNTIYVISRSLVAIKITDINHCAARNAYVDVPEIPGTRHVTST